MDDDEESAAATARERLQALRDGRARAFPADEARAIVRKLRQRDSNGRSSR